ncbi:MAG: TolC family protein [Spirochaetes bacterium]|nr:TolC family protein [Spirochaetota bacterium]
MKKLIIFQVIALLYLCSLHAEDLPESIKIDLSSALNIGIKNNYDLKYNRIEQLLSKKIITENWRRFLPTLGIDYGNAFNVTPYEEDTRTHSIKFKVQQPLYQGGRYYASYKIAQMNSKIKRTTYNILLNNLKAVIQKQYFSVIIQKEIKNIQQKLVEQADIQTGFAKAENNLGMLTSIDLAEIEAYQKTAQLDHVRSKNSLSKEYNTLKKALYLNWQQRIMIDEDIFATLQYKELDKSISELVSYAFQNRRDLMNTYSEVIQRKYDYKSNKYYYLPAVSLNFDYTLSGEKFYPFSRSWNVGIQLDFMFKGTSLSQSGNYGQNINDGSKSLSSSHSLEPFSDLGYISRYIQAEANLKTAKVKLSQLKQDIAIEIEDRYYQVKEKWDLLNILKDREKVLKKRLDVFMLKQKLGEAKRVDVVEAEIEYYQASTQTMQGVLEYINSIVDLELSLGADIGYLQIIKMR